MAALFVAAGTSGKLATSPDGITWTQVSPSLSGWTATAVRGHQGEWVAGGWYGNLIISDDGTTWTAVTSGITYTVSGIAYGAGLWVAVQSDGSATKYATSPDRSTWTARSHAFGTNYANGIAYGDGQFVVVGNSGKLATSPDGLTWTPRTSGFGTTAVRDVAYASGLWVAVGDNGKIATSPDGIAWTLRGSGVTTAGLRRVVYGCGLFVAVGNNGVVVTSPDGITWTLRDAGMSDIPFVSAVAGSASIIVIAGGAGAPTPTSRLVSSPDGITWTPRTNSFEPDYLASISYDAGVPPTDAAIDSTLDGDSAEFNVSAQHWIDFLPLGSWTYYACQIEHPTLPPLRLPVSSWQATLQVDRDSYLQTVVPAAAQYVNAIAERETLAELVVYRGARTDAGRIGTEIEMARVPLQTIMFQRGPFNATMTLSGYSNLGFALPGDGEPATTRTLQGARSVSTGGGQRVRAGIDWLLRPGMTVVAGSMTFPAGYINYYVMAGDSYMDVGSRGA